MQWFYEQEGSSQGPVSSQELLGLAQTGAINGSTPVWSEGMMTWEPLDNVHVPSAQNDEHDASRGKVFCTQCGTAVDANQSLSLFNTVVCAECKPLFLHRLKEGVVAPGSLRLASFMARAAARIIDWFILMVANWLFMALYAVGMNALNAANLYLLFTLILWFLQIGCAAAYEIVFLGRYAATPGKMLCRIKVVRSDGSRLSWGRATGRHFANMLTGMTLFIGYLLAAFDARRRALHDMICDTRVVLRTR